MIAAKLLQAACARLLHALSAQEVLACSDGDSAKRGAGEAVRALTFDLPYGRDGAVVEADLQGVFDHRDHDWRLKMLCVRVDARAVLGLIRTWLPAGRLETDGRVMPPETGPPQGGGLSWAGQWVFTLCIGPVG